MVGVVSVSNARFQFVMLSVAKHPRAKHSTPQAAVDVAARLAALLHMIDLRSNALSFRFARGPFAPLRVTEW
jgi:hypothetical protein